MLLDAVEKQVIPVPADASENGQVPYLESYPHFALLNGVLYFKDPKTGVMRIVVPPTWTNEVLRAMHEPGHHGIKATKSRVKALFWWPSIRRDVDQFVKNCKACDQHRSNRANPKAPLGELPIGGPFELVFLDLVRGQGSLNATDMGARTILVMIDSLTGWAEAVPIPDQTAKTVARVFFETWIARFGVPYRVHSDQGPQFESALFSRLCEMPKIHWSRTTPYRPQENGKVERFNRTFVSMLKKAVEDHPENWEEHLPAVLMAYRSTISGATGQTPYKLTFGREMRLGVDYGQEFPDRPSNIEDFASELAENLEQAHQEAREALGNRHRAAKEHYDKSSVQHHLKVGDLVRVRSHARNVGKATKFQPEWSSLKEVVEVEGPLIKVRDVASGDTRVVNHDSIRKSGLTEREDAHLSRNRSPRGHSAPPADRVADSERAGTSQPRSARTGTDESERKRATGADQSKESTAGRNQREGTTSGAHQKKKVSFRTDQEEENTTTGKDQLAPGEHEEECPSGEEEEVFVFEASDLEEMQQNSPRGDSDSGSEGPPSPRRSPRDRHPNHRPEYMYPIRHEVDRERMEHQQEGSDRGASGGFAWGSAAQRRTGRFMEGCNSGSNNKWVCTAHRLPPRW